MRRATNTLINRIFLPGCAAAALFFSIGCVEGPAISDPVESTRAVVLDTENFDRLVLDSDTLALVDFYLAGCNSCEECAWIVDSLARLFEGSALIGQVNVYANDTLGIRYAINEYPTFVFFQSGAEVTRRTYSQIRGQFQTSEDAFDSLYSILQGLASGQ